MPGSVAELIGGLGELIEWLKASVAGWRYIASKNYRKQIHKRWEGYSKLKIAWEIICGVGGIVFSVLLAYAAVVLIESAGKTAQLTENSIGKPKVPDVAPFDTHFAALHSRK